jgi:hypothetical protein
MHGPPQLQAALLGRVVRGILPWCSIQNNSLRTFALLTLGMLIDRCPLIGGAGGGNGGGIADDSSGGGLASERVWMDEFGTGGLAMLKQARLGCAALNQRLLCSGLLRWTFPAYPAGSRSQLVCIN